MGKFRLACLVNQFETLTRDSEGYINLISLDVPSHVDESLTPYKERVSLPPALSNTFISPCIELRQLLRK